MKSILYPVKIINPDGKVVKEVPEEALIKRHWERYEDAGAYHQGNKRFIDWRNPTLDENCYE